MKLLFVHGGERLKEDIEGNYYTDGSYNQDVWNRYLNIFENVSVMFRKDPVIYEKNYAKQKFQFFDKEKINYTDLPDLYSSVPSFLNLKKRKCISNKIEKAITENDCLIVRLPSKEGGIAIKYAKKYKKPYLIEVVGCPWASYWNHSIKGKILAPINYLSLKNTMRNSPFAIYVTSRFLQGRYPCNGKSIGCSDVSLPSFELDILNNRLNKINNTSLKKPIILGTTAAIDVRYKGQEYVIKAISKLNREGYNFIYHLAGGGDNSYLKALANKYNVADKVVFLGSLAKEEVYKFLDNIDIYIQPSKTEGLPRALVEAMSRGCPSIGSDIGGIPELLGEEFIFQSGSVNKIYELLKSIDLDFMLNSAKQNFEKSKEFDKVLLEKKRSAFLEEFKVLGNNRFSY